MNKTALKIAALIVLWLAMVFVAAQPIARGELSSSTQRVLKANPPIYVDGLITREQKWGNESIDLEAYSRQMKQGFRWKPCTCSMCGVVNHWKLAYRDQQAMAKVQESKEPEESKEVPQPNYGATSSEDMDQGIQLADIGPTDVVAELGCGIAEWSIRAVEAGAAKAYGFELDYQTYLAAKKHVAKAAQSGRIAAGSVIVLHKDVMEVDLTKYGATVALTFLDDKLLVKMTQAGIFRGLNRVISPFHSIDIDGMSGRQYGNLWMYAERSSDLPGEPQKRYTFTPLSIEQPAAEAISEAPGQYDDIYILKWTADYCEPCRRFNRVELPKLKKLGIDVTPIDIAENQKLAAENGITGIPQFEICYKSTKKKMHTGRFSGYRTAEYLVKQIDHYLTAKANIDLVSLRQ